MQPFSSQQLLAALDTLNIAYTNHHHEAVFTVDESEKIKFKLPGAHSKNLFLRNKKGQMWLFSTIGTKQIDLKVLGERLGGGRLSFGSPERLMSNLGVTPGSVTPFACINDKDCNVKMVLEADFKTYDQVNFHPLSNDQTTTLSLSDLERFLDHVRHKPDYLTLV